ncbi:carboxymethylenebutenolidase [Grus japonensis]|uniref:Carboxymethylenebutenolidase homolog n=1 Tax=Grus japonensis TaxID=30415 RepID=A0ABC9WCS2_GRUJA
MTPVLSLSSSPPNPKVCRRVEEHLETGWAAAGAKLSAELVFFFLCLEKPSWYLCEQKQRAGLNRDPVLQVSKWLILSYMILEKDRNMGALDMKTICPDFFKGTEPWKTTDHWADFADWMKDHDPMKVDKDSEERYNLLNPTFFIFGEKDHTISYDQITLLEEKLKQYCKVAYKIKVYPGQVHGFAQLKPEDMKPDDKPYIEEARKDMIDWIKIFI